MKELTPEQKQVYDVIVNSNGKITQLQIARRVWVGCHEKFEGYDQPKQSTLRKVRQIIRDLRMKHGLFILSDREGYWVLKSKEEGIEFISQLEKKAKASAQSHMVTYRMMSKMIGVKSDFFEGQRSRSKKIILDNETKSLF